MFITFEGIDFSGKSTQIKLFTEKLDQLNKSYMMVREPGGLELCEEIRETILDNKHSDMTPETELLLYSASRAQLVIQKIKPALNSYDYIIGDRFFDSTTVYQGFGRQLDIEFIKQLNQFATRQLTPDITFLLDVSVEESYERRKSAGRSEDRIEKAGTQFFTRVRDGYLVLAANEKRIHVLDGTKPADEIHNKIMETIKMLE